MALHRFALLFALLLFVAACGTETAADAPVEEEGDNTAEDVAGDVAADAPEPDEGEQGEGLTAVTTVFPLADVAREIAPGAEVTLLTSSGQDPHDLELSPGDRALLESAHVVLYLGDIDFQPQVEAAVTEATGEVVAVADIAGEDDLLDFGGHSHDDAADHADDDEGDDHSHDDDGHDDDGDHGNGTDEVVDPHVWFDPQVMAEVAEEIGEAFAAVDADRAADYRERAEELHDELLALDDEIDGILDGCARDTAIVSHEAYAYLLEPRGLDQEGISGAGGHGDASPQRLAELTERIHDEGIPAVLAEPLEGRADAEALASEAGVELLEINPLEIGTDELFEQGYLDALRDQANTFAEALECG